jgi:hypothetical protein
VTAKFPREAQAQTFSRLYKIFAYEIFCKDVIASKITISNREWGSHNATSETSRNNGSVDVFFYLRSGNARSAPS